MVFMCCVTELQENYERIDSSFGSSNYWDLNLDPPPVEVTPARVLEVPLRRAGGSSLVSQLGFDIQKDKWQRCIIRSISVGGPLEEFNRAAPFGSRIFVGDLVVAVNGLFSPRKMEKFLMSREAAPTSVMLKVEQAPGFEARIEKHIPQMPLGIGVISLPVEEGDSSKSRRRQDEKLRNSKCHRNSSDAIVSLYNEDDNIDPSGECSDFDSESTAAEEAREAPGQTALRVVDVNHAGIIPRYNAEHRDFQVTTHCDIVEVNGERLDPAQMLCRLEHDLVLELVLRLRMD
mmetsp:Transcript_86890/g.181866  ORF Transcript_86890/g.181866 Transcript_86890/m.181866 type:complete len:289 (-) Transcript_86890:92-958(-)|eukprot:CAMPEP_0206453270 /NCGR_PEP_ID=MMETSP0324_2-20121206/20447_1 /ASSEMBLY_ACC=CAM_ASM_000836 /TAXON_ID=2866 /ORGANISM="Crypthecodinium cohnii, Strain Seligo" /LENGTH=288 /DNA_ID=CAMNT_0053923531 /DNA_START=113 /DNA_END=979 /DNA_ORIENTATION=+